jgi:hypothetical protein
MALNITPTAPTLMARIRRVVRMLPIMGRLLLQTLTRNNNLDISPQQTINTRVIQLNPNKVFIVIFILFINLNKN